MGLKRCNSLGYTIELHELPSIRPRTFNPECYTQILHQSKHLFIEKFQKNASKRECAAGSWISDVARSSGCCTVNSWASHLAGLCVHMRLFHVAIIIIIIVTTTKFIVIQKNFPCLHQCTVHGWFAPTASAHNNSLAAKQRSMDNRLVCYTGKTCLLSICGNT